MKRFLKPAVVAAAAMMLFLCAAPAALASVDVPYDSYTYNYREYVEYTPAPYIPAGSVTGLSLNIGEFRNPQDISIAPDGRLLVADTDNDRVVIVNAEMTEALMVIEGFDNNGTPDSFNRPFGVTVSDRGLIYIADSLNRRIVVLDETGLSAVQIIENPQSDMFAAEYVFTPLKVAVDYADRIYVISRNVFQGLMVFSPEGEFMSFFGTINVQISVWQRVWRALSSRRQREVGILFIPTEFTGVDVDDDGFVYASCIDPLGEQAAFRLNPKGEDVIKTGANGNVGGDLDWMPRGAGTYSGPSYIVDIIIRDKGLYSILCSRRGRIFTYDFEGNLLYIFGGMGAQVGTFRTPAAMAHTGDKLLVLDSGRQEIMLFAETEYGRLINEAVGLRFDGDERLAVDLWRQVLAINENLELANVGIGKAYLTDGNNSEAMKHLRLGMDRTYYSVAFKRYRNDLLKENLGAILTVAVVAALALYIWNTVKGKGGRKGDLLADD
ncbi:MAG: NHL repeat-containing protein [Oscillospiraceae bacterium]|nr:NHL repeat-containing protein [Oscillospiraceae bacterium]